MSTDIFYIKKKSGLTGKEHNMAFPLEHQDAILAWAYGKDDRLVQDALPFLNAGQREFLLTGSTPEEWDAIRPSLDEDALGGLDELEE